MNTPSANEDRFRVLFEHAPDAIFIENREGVILDANPAACRLQGVPRAELVGRNVLDLVPEAERARVQRDFEGWFSGAVTRYEGYTRRAGGDPVAVEITGTPLLFDGQPAVLLNVRDISQRRAAEQALLDREWQMSYALDQGDAIVFRRSFVADRYDYIAPGIERLTGYRPDEMTPSRWDRLVEHCEFAGELAALPQGEPRNRFLEGQVSRWQSEVLIRRRQGDTRWVLDMSTIVRDASGQPVGALGVLQDITDFHTAADALRASEGRLRMVTSQLPAIMWMLDRELRFTLSEGAGLAALGLKPGQVVGQTLAEFMGDGEDARESQEAHRQALQGESRHFEQVWQERHFLVHVEPLRDPARGIVGVAGIAQDVTDVRRMEEQIRSAQRLESLGMMAGGIAHDFNNLLVGILGNADLALQELPAGTPAAEFVADIQKAGLRASELTNLMLAFAGRSRFAVGPVNLNGLVEEAVHLVRAGVSKRIDFLRSLAHPLPLVEGDGAQIRQVVLNLLVNGAEAIGEESGQLQIQTGVTALDADTRKRLVGVPALPEGAYAFVRVRDSGAGMDERTRTHIFEPFFSTKFRGRGLGLASALGTIRSHRGGITVESKPGAGSCFTLYLPLPAQPLSQDPPAPPARATLHGTGTLLVADDEEAVRTVASRMLERAGFQVVAVHDGRAAVDYCRQNPGPPVCVLLDLTMPRLGGEQALQEIRALHPRVPVILMSGFDESEALHRFAALRVQAFLQKPFDQATLYARLQTALRPAPPSA